MDTCISPTTTRAETPVRKHLGAHSRVIRRGAIGDTIDGRSREGRYLRHCEQELTRQLGGSLSFAQQILVRRAARAMLRLELFDEKMDKGGWSDHDARTYGGLSNNLRLCLRELGIKAPPAPKPVSELAEYFSRPPPEDDE
jgi:hypothetical protein